MAFEEKVVNLKYSFQNNVIKLEIESIGESKMSKKSFQLVQSILKHNSTNCLKTYPEVFAEKAFWEICCLLENEKKILKDAKGIYRTIPEMG